MPPLPLSASLRTLPTLPTGWRPADCAWTQPKRRSWRRSLSRRAVAVDRGDSHRFSTQPGRHHPAGCTCCRCLLQCIYQLRQLRPVTGSLSADAAKTLVQAFISSRLDYSNALLDGITDGLMHRLQSVQNAAARLITGTPHHDHISPILRQLHWLPVRHRVTFKIAVLVFLCLTGQAPAYLADDCQLTSDVRTCRLRSTDTAMCVVRRSNNTFGDRCFCVRWSTSMEHAASTSTPVW